MAITGSSSSSAAVLLAAGSLLVAGLGYKLVSRTSSKYERSKPATSSSGSGTLTDIDDDDNPHNNEAPGDCITADEVVQIFERLYLEVQNVYAQLLQQVQQLQRMGQAVPPSQLKALFRQEMSRVLVLKQTAVCDEFDIDYDCWEEATWEFLQDDAHPGVLQAVTQLQKFWEHATDEPVTGWRPGQAAQEEEALLTAERVLEVAARYFDAHAQAFAELVQQYQADGRDTTEAATQQALQRDFGAAMSQQDAGEAALEMEDVSMKCFEKSVAAHQNNPVVGRALGMMQMKQQQDIQNAMAMVD
jgi:hypothetical protein